MRHDDTVNRPIWLAPDGRRVQIIDQRQLPHAFVIADLADTGDVIRAIREMMVRGAPLIGVTGAYGVYLAVFEADGDRDRFEALCDRIAAARPTAVNLVWAVDRVRSAVREAGPPELWAEAARTAADGICEAEADACRRIGEAGLEIVTEVSRRREGEPVRILTHCNAGWLACVEHGTATAPIYAAHRRGIPVQVWVDETRPLNQGARLTAWELGRAGVPHTVIVDNAGGHLMQRGMVDLVIVGTDRTTRTGDVANKIGTYLKALAARDNGVPFYVALPGSTFDGGLDEGQRIPIEERDPAEVSTVWGIDGETPRTVRLTPADSPAANYAFDVTPARLVTGFITDRGICGASEAEICRLFPELIPH